MRVRVVASLVFALAGAVVLAVSLQARSTELRHQALQSAAVDGGAAVSPQTAADAYLAALAAFRSDQKQPPATSDGPRAAAIATVQQTIGSALAAGQPAALRSQLENLAGVLEQELAVLGGDQTTVHNGAAAHWLQRAVLDDGTNADAKFNLELLLSRHPKSGRTQARPSTAPSPGHNQTQSLTPNGKQGGKSGSAKSRKLGSGF
jgi:hypothetical protein